MYDEIAKIKKDTFIEDDEYVIITNIIEHLLKQKMIKSVPLPEKEVMKEEEEEKTSGKEKLKTWLVLSHKSIYKSGLKSDMNTVMVTEPLDWKWSPYFNGLTPKERKAIEFQGGYLSNDKLFINKLVTGDVNRLKNNSIISEADIQCINLLQKQPWFIDNYLKFYLDFSPKEMLQETENSPPRGGKASRLPEEGSRIKEGWLKDPVSRDKYMDYLASIVLPIEWTDGLGYWDENGVYHFIKEIRGMERKTYLPRQRTLDRGQSAYWRNIGRRLPAMEVPSPSEEEVEENISSFSSDSEAASFSSNLQSPVNEELSIYTLTSELFKWMSRVKITENDKYLIRILKNTLIDSKFGSAKNYPIFFPWFMDFRLRKYCNSGLINPTSSKMIRENLLLPTSYPVEWNVLKIQFVRTFCNKLLTRNECFNTHWDEVFKELCKLSNLSWAQINLLRQYWDGLYLNCSRRLTYVDHTCSGLMILALVFKDEKAAKLLNMTNTETVYDFYTYISEKIISELEEKRDKVNYHMENIQIIEDPKSKLNAHFQYWLRKVITEHNLKSTTRVGIAKDAFLATADYPIVEDKGRLWVYSFSINKMTKKIFQNFIKTGKIEQIVQHEIYYGEKVLWLFNHEDIQVRSLVKKLIMTIPYMAGDNTLRDDLITELTKQINASKTLSSIFPIETTASGKKKDMGIDFKKYVAQWILMITKDILRKELPAIMNGISLLSEAAKKKDNLCWTNAEGSQFDIRYLIRKTREIQYGPRKKQTLLLPHYDEEDVDYDKHKQSVIANWIHSIDASLISKVVNKFKTKFPDVNIMVIHDQYGVPSPYVPALIEIINESLNDILNDDSSLNSLAKHLEVNKKIKFGNLRVVGGPNIVV